jgi:hypothetical protein
MILFDLIIQRTKDGLEEEYISENLKPGNLNSEIEETLKDERRTATKLANQSDVYSIQITKNYRVYSLIVSNIIDNQKRAGFYAIRLYTPKKYPLSNFQVLLNDINNKYVEYERNGIPKDSQDYSETLRYLPLEVKQQDFISVQSNEEAFFYFDSSNTQLSVFNDTIIALFNKVYAFNQDVAVSSELIQSLGLKSLDEKRHNLKEVRITNNDRILNELRINNVPIGFKSDDDELTVILKKNDLLEYNTKDNPKFKQDSGFFIDIKKVYKAPPKPITPKGPKNRSFFDEYGMYLLIVVMILFLGIGSWYFILDGKSFIEKYNNPVVEEKIQIEDKKEPSIDSTEIIFEYEGSQKDSSVFKTSFPKLEKYRFRLDNKKWSYKNTERRNRYVEFNKKTLDDIIKNDSLKFNEDLKKEFFKNLKDKSGQEVIDKKEENIKPESTIGKTKKTSKSPTIPKIIPVTEDQKGKGNNKDEFSNENAIEGKKNKKNDR